MITAPFRVHLANCSLAKTAAIVVRILLLCSHLRKGGFWSKGSTARRKMLSVKHHHMQLAAAS